MLQQQWQGQLQWDDKTKVIGGIGPPSQITLSGSSTCLVRANFFERAQASVEPECRPKSILPCPCMCATFMIGHLH